MQDVEHLKHHGIGVSPAPTEAPAKPGEVRMSVAAQTHQLTVERRPTLAKHTGDRRQLRKVL